MMLGWFWFDVLITFDHFHNLLPPSAAGTAGRSRLGNRLATGLGAGFNQTLSLGLNACQLAWLTWQDLVFDLGLINRCYRVAGVVVSNVVIVHVGIVLIVPVGALGSAW